MRMLVALLTVVVAAGCGEAPRGQNDDLYGELWGFRFERAAESVEPAVDSDAAQQVARATAMHSTAPEAVALGILTCIRGETFCARFGEPRLAWGVLWVDEAGQEYVFVDAATGEIIHHLTAGPA
jgi:predicted amidohydrolase YtcJ